MLKYARLIFFLFALVGTAADGAAQEKRVFVSHDAPKEIRRLSTQDFPQGVVVQLTGSINTYILSRVCKAIATNSALSFELDLSLVTGMTALEKEVLDACPNITAVTLPDCMQKVQPNAFRGCSSLTELLVTAQNDAFVSEKGALYSKEDGKLVLCAPGAQGSFEIPASAKEVLVSAFSNSPEITAITVVPENESYAASDGILYNKAFSVLVRCPQGRVQDVRVPVSVSIIGECAFEGCSRIAAISFDGQSAGESSLPGGVTEFSRLAFSGCTALASFSIPETVTRIGKQAFLACSGLKTLFIPASVGVIGSRAFYRTDLESIEFAETKGWTNGKRKLPDLADSKENPERFNHPGKYWPNDMYRIEDDW